MPFFGDMSMNLTIIFFKTPKLCHLKWEHDPNDEMLIKSYLLTNHIDAMRAEYREYLTEFVPVISKVCAVFLHIRKLTLIG